MQAIENAAKQLEQAIQCCMDVSRKNDHQYAEYAVHYIKSAQDMLQQVLNYHAFIAELSSLRSRVRQLESERQ